MIREDGTETRTTASSPSTPVGESSDHRREQGAQDKEDETDKRRDVASFQEQVTGSERGEELREENADQENEGHHSAIRPCGAS